MRAGWEIGAQHSILWSAGRLTFNRETGETDRFMKFLFSGLKKLFAGLNGNDVLIFTGLGLLGAGIGMVSIPGALVTVGGILLTVGLLGALRGGGVK